MVYVVGVDGEGERERRRRRERLEWREGREMIGRNAGGRSGERRLVLEEKRTQTS